MVDAEGRRDHEVVEQVFPHFNVVIVAAHIGILIIEVQRAVGDGEHIQGQGLFQALCKAQAVQGHADARAEEAVHIFLTEGALGAAAAVAQGNERYNLLLRQGRVGAEHEIHVVRLAAQGQHDIVLADAAEAFGVDIGQEGIIP